MGILSSLAIAFAKDELDSLIEDACESLDNYIANIRFNNRTSFHYTFRKGKQSWRITLGVKKTRKSITFYIGSLPLRFALKSVKTACMSAISTALNIL